ncbi:translocon-associated protein subunit alpha-like [Sycon ciliatum]|uniref:translocon-associated protein subunit alpha-like n=1 Tax=Sycon ciliatum TaxID=27933 RepID=UPI0020ADBDA3|eukprot:scpid72273/ scgid6804/ Translocon-associated protein subunit alpha; Signal sequence receptor subunit alpha
MRFLAVFLILLLSFQGTLYQNSRSLAFAQDAGDDGDDVDAADPIGTDDDGEGGVEDGDDPQAASEMPGDDAVAAGEEEEETDTIKASPDTDTAFIFPDHESKDLPVGKEIRCLIGFTNTGEMDFIIDHIEASFHYPQDYSYIIQNFTAQRYEAIVKPSTQQSFAYSFFAHEFFANRPFATTVNVHYHDENGTMFRDAVFNETINTYEIEEGFDGETFFMYVLLGAIVVLGAALAVYYYAGSSSKKRAPAQAMEMGTRGDDDIDYDWIPSQNIAVHKASASPRKSPRQRAPRKEE